MSDEQKESAPADAPHENGMIDSNTRTAIVTGTFGLAGALLTVVVTWALNRVDKHAPSPPSVNIAPAASPVSASASTSPLAAPASVTASNPTLKSSPAKIDLEQLLKQSPISFADWRAMVRENYSYEQRLAIFGGDLGKRVVWQGVFDQYNLITLAEVHRDDAYILVMYANEADRRASPLRPGPALCHFPAIAKRKLSELRAGQQIVVSGVIGNPQLTGQLLGTELQNCELVAALDD